MQLPHWKSDLQAPPGQLPHEPKTPSAKRRSPANTSELLVAHASLAVGAWAGLRPGGAVGWGGAGGAHLAPGTACGSTATASLPSLRRKRGHAALGLLRAR